MAQANSVLFTICLVVLVLILSVELAGAGGGGKEHVHLKIHVPNIINHRHHTKVVFIHKKRPPVTKHKQKYKYEKKNLIENLFGYGPNTNENYQKALKEIKFERLKDAEIANNNVKDSFLRPKTITGGYRVTEEDNFSSEIVD